MKRLSLLVGMAGIAATIGFASPAYADGDAAFLSALSSAGLSHNGAASAVSAGRAVCQLMDAGMSSTDVVVAVQTTNPGFTLDRAAQFAAISASAFCPEHL